MDDSDFFKNQKAIREDEEVEEINDENEVKDEDDSQDQFRKYYHVDEEESSEEEIEEEPPTQQNHSFNPFMNDYMQFMSQSSADYMLYSTMDLMNTMNIFREVRNLFTRLDDWDRIVIFYAYELMQRNMQVCYKLGLYLFKNRDEDIMSQMIYWGLLLFCMANVQTAYSYLIYRVYRLDKDLARRLHEHMKDQFMFFDNPEDMAGSFNDFVPNRLDARNRGL